MELIETENNPISGQNGAYHFEGKFFRQTADIDYSNVTKDENGCNYYTYGSRRVFCGNYDGYGHTISGIVTKIRSRDALGIFGYVRGGCIKNLTVTSSTFTTDQLILENANNFTGGIAGYVSEGGVIDNCHVTNSVYVLAGDKAEYHGGIVGYLSDGSLVSNCTSAAHVCLTVNPKEKIRYFGGIVGINYQSEVRNCLYLGNDVNAYEYYGAIAGSNTSGTMTHNFYHGGTLPGIGSSTGAADARDACRAICLDALPTGVTVDDYIAYDGKYYVHAGMLLDAYGNTELMAQNQSEGVTKYTLTGRTLYKDGDWNTLCLPFDVTLADATELQGAEARELQSASFDNTSGELSLTFSDPVETLVAGKAYIVKLPIGIQYSQYSRDRYYDAKAFDGDPSTVASIMMDDNTWPVIFATSGAINVTGYKLYAGDNSSCLPTKWELRAKLNDDDDWIVIDSRDESSNAPDAMPREAGASKQYTLATDKQGFYRYFNLFVNGVVNANLGTMKLGEIELVGDLQNQQIVNPTFTNVTLTATEPTATVCGPVTFKGTYAPIAYDAEDRSVLFLGAKNTLYYPLESTHIGAFRAYFQLNGITAGDPETGAIRSFKLLFGDESQGIASPQVEMNHSPLGDTKAAPLYDLSGRRAHRLSKGIYIRNGRKIIIK